MRGDTAHLGLLSGAKMLQALDMACTARLAVFLVTADAHSWILATAKWQAVKHMQPHACLGCTSPVNVALHPWTGMFAEAKHTQPEQQAYLEALGQHRALFGAAQVCPEGVHQPGPEVDGVPLRVDGEAAAAGRHHHAHELVRTDLPANAHQLGPLLGWHVQP